MAIPLFLQPCVQLLKIRLQVLPVLFLGDPIHPHRCVRTLPVVCACEGRHIEQMRQLSLRQPRVHGHHPSFQPHLTQHLQDDGEFVGCVCDCPLGEGKAQAVCKRGEPLCPLPVDNATTNPVHTLLGHVARDGTGAEIVGRGGQGVPPSPHVAAGRGARK
jgi:hypothetical protein